jgi:hypothetical protein
MTDKPPVLSSHAEPLLDLDAVATRLGVSAKTVRRRSTAASLRFTASAGCYG